MRLMSIGARIGALLLPVACVGAPDDGRADRSSSDSASAVQPCLVERPAAAADSQVVAAYFACESGTPGQLYPAYRQVAAGRPALEAALTELLRGPTPEERALGLRSFFGASAAGALRSVRRSAGGDTATIDLEPLADRLPDDPAARSFLPPGVMAELTWTIFAQFPEVEVVRFSFGGSEAAFWRWLGGPLQPFTRSDWEQV